MLCVFLDMVMMVCVVVFFCVCVFCCFSHERHGDMSTQLSIDHEFEFYFFMILLDDF